MEISELALDPVFPLVRGRPWAGDFTFLSTDWFICRLGVLGGVGPRANSVPGTYQEPHER